MKILIEQSNERMKYTESSMFTYDLHLINEQTSSYSLTVKDVRQQDVPNTLRSLLGNQLIIYPSDSN